ncbi:MAG TPA: sulfurtransferase complex subunit TusB [Pseudomonadales bacterium]|nr:sulfurtransferase complex subunit TusB [Pseudomonadales bacterium]
MPALHLVAASPDSSAALQSCLRCAADDDAILLIGNGVYGAVAGPFLRSTRRVGLKRWFALEADVVARGMRSQLAESVTLVDDAAFVDLVANHQPIVSWS